MDEAEKELLDSLQRKALKRALEQAILDSRDAEAAATARSASLIDSAT